MTNYLIFGGSRGLGAMFSHALPKAGDTVWLVSRSEPDLTAADGVRRLWIQADLTQRGIGTLIAEKVGEAVLDVCLYNAGIWEQYAFSDAYDFEQVPEDENERIIRVNLLSAINGVQKLLPALRRSANGKIIFIGANAGLENAKRPEVATAASKFALRGLTHALREIVRKDGIGVTCLNLGDVGTVAQVDGGWTILPNDSGRVMIDPADIVILLRAVIALSKVSIVKEIDLLGMAEPI